MIPLPQPQLQYSSASTSAPTGTAILARQSIPVSSPSPSARPEVSVHVITSCIQCDTFTPADRRYNARLRAFLKDDEKLLNALATIGLRFDQHLDLLLRIKKSTLEMFFMEHIPASKLDIFMKWRLLRLFGNGNNGEASTMITTSSADLGSPMDIDTNSDENTLVGDDDEPEDLTLIPPPTLEDEVAIINYAYFDFRVSLQCAMQLEDDEDDALFGDLLVRNQGGSSPLQII